MGRLRFPSPRTVVLAAAAAAAVAFALPLAEAQGFGRNKPSHDRFDWKVYESPHFDIHYYPEEEHLLEDVVNEAESAYADISERLDHDIPFRIPMLIYQTDGHFRQTNVILQFIPDAAGAFAEPFQRRMVLPIDDPPDKRYKLIRHELTHIFEYSILYGESYRRVIRAQPPIWLMEGLASYIADDEDTFDQMVIRDAVVNNLVPSVRQLNVLSFLTYRFGNALFSFIEEEWGVEGVRTFLFEYRQLVVGGGVDKAFQDTFGLTTDQFDRRFARYLRKRYLPILTGKRSPDEYGKEIGLTKPGRFTFSPALSPSGDLIAALATPKQELDAVILSTRDGELIKNLTRGFTTKYDSVVTGVFSGQRDLAWSPGGDQLAFFVQRDIWRDLLIYDPVSGKRIERIKLQELSKALSPSYSPDGLKIAFAADRGGFRDIFILDLETRELTNVTDDPYYDGNPSWSADGKRLLYNRRIGSFAKIYSVEVDAPERKTAFTAGAASDLQPALSRDGRHIYFTSDRGEHGVFNLHRLDVSNGEIERLTDLVGGAFGPVSLEPEDDGVPQVAFTAYFGGTFRLFKMKLSGKEVERAKREGKREPQTSPLAPSRKRAAEEEAEEALDGTIDEPDDDRGAFLPGADPTLLPPPKKKSRLGRLFSGAASSWPAGELRPDRFLDGVGPFAGPSPSLPSIFGPQVGGGDAEITGDEDLEPFRAPLQLGIDEERKKDYKPKWSLDSPGIQLGLTDDGRILSNIDLRFSDTVGDRRFQVASVAVGTFSNFYASYVNLSRRIDWGARVRDYRDFFLIFDGGEELEQADNRFSSVDVFANYPVTQFFRLEGSVGYAQERNDRIVTQFDPDLGIFFPAIDEFRNDYPFATFAMVRDTTRFQNFGPYHGQRLRLQFSGYEVVSGDLEGRGVGRTFADFRFYQKLTARSLIAYRVTGIFQGGATTSTIGLGGINQLRGLEFRELFGDNVVWSNLELRFPLLDNTRFAFGLPFGPVRGFMFLDAGTAWFRDQFFFENGELTRGKAVFDGSSQTGFRKYDARLDDDTLQDLYVSWGLGVQVYLLGLPLNWSFSREYDGDDFRNSRSQFYIIFDW